MSRIRTIKPGFFTSEDLADLPLSAERTWVGLWTHCDDHGRFKDNVKLIKAAIWPLRPHSLQDVEQDLVLLAEAGRIVRYVAAEDGKPYLAVVNWHVHQSIQKPGRPKYPAPSRPVNPTTPGEDGYCAACSGHSGSAHGSLTEGYVNPPVGLQEESGSAPVGLSPGREGKGRDQGGDARGRASGPPHLPADPGPEPPLRCLRHNDDPAPGPCPACGDARRTREAWVKAQADAAKNRPTPIPSRPVCPLHPDAGPGSGLGDCPACKAEAAPAPSLRGLRAVAGGA